MLFAVMAPTGGNSTDPGEENVLQPSDGGPTDYVINGTTHVGTLTLAAPSAAVIANAVWSKSMSGYSDATTYGGFVRKLLTVGKFLGLK